MLLQKWEFGNSQKIGHNFLGFNRAIQIIYSALFQTNLQKNPLLLFAFALYNGIEEFS